MTDWCIHIANFFYLASFVGRDMLWLRTLTCGGLTFGLIFFSACTPTPMYGPAFWHAVFLLINLYQIKHLIGERHRLALNDRQRVVSRGMLEGMTEEELRNSLTHAVYTNSDRVELLTDQSKIELTPDEIAFRDIAFSRLSRNELINLLSRRVWQSIRTMRPKWRAKARLAAEPAG